MAFGVAAVDCRVRAGDLAPAARRDAIERPFFVGQGRFRVVPIASMPEARWLLMVMLARIALLEDDPDSIDALKDKGLFSTYFPS